MKLIISGCNGHMGRTVAAIADLDPDISIVAGFDVAGFDVMGFDTTCSDTAGVQMDRDTGAVLPGRFPIFESPACFNGEAHAVVDFSSPAALAGLLEYGLSNKTPLILCTTGYSPEQIADIENAALQIPVFRSGNMSLGINLLADLVRKACCVLGDAFDVEIVERHHRRKVDAPSGTAMMLADAASSSLPYDPEYIYERQSRRKPRDTREIGISAVRGGTVVGEHEVIFAGLNEVIELRHSATSRDVFAAGAVRAAKFMANVTAPGLYSMSDVIK